MYRKKWISMGMALVMVLMALPLTQVRNACAMAQAGEFSRSAVYSKKGTTDDEEITYTEIYTAEDLAAIDNDPEGNYILMNDIDLTEETKEGGTWETGWTPLKSFYGIFNGNGYRIKGLHIFGDVGNYVGLFSKLYGTVMNLGMVDCDIRPAGEDNDDGGGVGAIAGYMYYNTSIYNCFVTGILEDNMEADYNSNWYMRFYHGVGGLVGKKGGGEINGCYSTAEVSCSAGYGVGGIVGCNNSGYVEKSYFAGKLHVTNDYCGYISGNNEYEIYVNNNYFLSGSAVVEEGCDYTPNTEDATSIASARFSNKSAFIGFDFDETWEIDSYSAYKYPQLRSCRQSKATNISVVTEPQKLTYLYGEEIDFTDGTIKVTYEDGYDLTLIITENMIQDYDPLTIGKQTVQIICGGYSLPIDVEVKEIPVEKVTLSADTQKIELGQTLQLTSEVLPTDATDPSLTYTSSDETGASVDEEGLVMGIKVGDYTITAASVNGIEATFDVHVYAVCSYLVMSQKTAALTVGETKQLTVQLSPVDCEDVIEWKSENENVATVEDGLVQAVGKGTTNIIASTSNGVEASCKITVEENAEVSDNTADADEEQDVSDSEKEDEVSTGTSSADEKQDVSDSEKEDEVSVGASSEDEEQDESDSEDEDGVSVGTSSAAEKQDESDSEDEDEASVETSSADEEAELLKPEKVSGLTLKNIRSRKIKISYNDIEEADGYIIRYSTNSNMRNAKERVTTNTKITLKNLRKGKKYYVKVCAYVEDEDGIEMVMGKWSKKKSIKVKK
ncbi:MAG: Ig-like domain-containing protein [Clostridiaceae bacterium]|nr:Ig-like domain-containing protein [Clostridiaceae bacterium]